MKTTPSLTSLLLFPLLASAYTWQFASQPRQCQNLTLSIQGSGQPPYNLLLVPTGPKPFQNTTEFRKIHNIPFSGNGLSFKLDYPGNSSFVAVVRCISPRFLRHLLISPHTVFRSATRAGLVPVAPALLSPFSHRPIRAVTIPLSPGKSLGFFTPRLLDSLNVNRYGCIGIHLPSMGASLHQSFAIRCFLIVFVYHDMYCPVEPSTFTAPS